MRIQLLIILGLCLGIIGCAPKPFIHAPRIDMFKAQEVKKPCLQDMPSYNPRCAFRRYYEQALNQDPYAQYMLSLFYLKGIGVPYSLEKSVHWYKKAEHHPNRLYAQYRIGNMFLKPQWFKKDEKEALVWLTRAAERGCALAQNALGDLYHEGGETFNINPALALHWYKQSAMQHNPIGQYSMGLLYYNGQGVPQSYKMAGAWFEKAAEQGAPYAQYMLARMYEEGLGVKVNYSKAYGWWSISPQQRFEDPQKEYQVFMSRLSPNERIEALRFSEQYHRNYHKSSSPAFPAHD